MTGVDPKKDKKRPDHEARKFFPDKPQKIPARWQSLH